MAKMVIEPIDRPGKPDPFPQIRRDRIHPLQPARPGRQQIDRARGVADQMERLLQELVRYAPGSINLLTTRTGRLQRMNSITADLRERIGFSGPVYRFNHHLCHAASTFFASPFAESAILTLDGIGDWEACWWGRGHGSQIEELGAINWPRLLGHVYAAFTEFLGFKTFSDEYRVMGLAPCGQPVFAREMAEISWPTKDGYDINLDYFTFPTGHVPRFSAKVVEKFGPPLAHPGQEIPEHYRNIAASLQVSSKR